MKNVFIFILMLTALSLSLNVEADEPNYDLETGIVSFPRVTVNNSEAYINVDLLLNQDGTWKILAFEQESDAELTLTGAWVGSTSGMALSSFNPGITCDTELFKVTLTQNINEITGEAVFVDGCHAGQSGIIIGTLRRNAVFFELILEDETVMTYSGSLTNDFCALGGSYSYSPNDEQGVWALSCQP